MGPYQHHPVPRDCGPVHHNALGAGNRHPCRPEPKDHGYDHAPGRHSPDHPPPILWITLVMVWAGTGTLLPVLVVTASLFPPLFISTATAAAHLDRRLFDLAQIYQIKKWVMIKDLILPGIFPHFLAGFSYALGSCLKITAVAEFLGADQGMGARVYWAFRMMDMEALFAWALVLISIGVSMEIFWIRPLRVLSSKKGGQNADP
ncbi:MAG: ABC transporter permease subunit [Desulfobacter sp.]|nr:MAG: ABC transporter permease subunit [Desulfobacter sp.]